MSRVSEYPPKWWTSLQLWWLLHGWCHVKLLSSRRTFCVHRATMHQFKMSLHSKPHTNVHVFSCNCMVTCTFGRMTGIFYVLLWYTTRGWNGYRNKSQPGKLTLENKIICPSCLDSNLRPFDNEPGVLINGLSPLDLYHTPHNYTNTNIFKLILFFLMHVSINTLKVIFPPRKCVA